MNDASEAKHHRHAYIGATLLPRSSRSMLVTTINLARESREAHEPPYLYSTDWMILQTKDGHFIYHILLHQILDSLSLVFL